MLLKNLLIEEVVNGIKALDGTKEQRFKFKATTLYSLAKNLRRLVDAANDLNEARMKSVKANGLDLDPKNPEKLIKFQDEWRDLMRGETEIVLTLIGLSELNLEENNIPVTSLAGLAPIIKE
jgi:hypothetical protein